MSNMATITDLVNTSKPYKISSDLFEGEIIVYIKGFTDENGKVRDSEYFAREDRQGITWSIQVQGDSSILLFLPNCHLPNDLHVSFCDESIDFLAFETDHSNEIGRFVVPQSADNVLFGNIFDRPLQLPWGTGAVLKFMQYVSSDEILA